MLVGEVDAALGGDQVLIQGAVLAGIEPGEGAAATGVAVPAPVMLPWKLDKSHRCSGGLLKGCVA